MAKSGNEPGNAPDQSADVGKFDQARIDALILERMESHDAVLQAEINQLRVFMERLAEANSLQNVLENGIGEIVDKLVPLRQLTGEPQYPDERQAHVLQQIRSELARPPDSDAGAELYIASIGGTSSGLGQRRSGS